MFRKVAPYDYPIDIERADIDFMGHVNNASYLKWVQAAIISHWERLAPTEMVAKHLWVALKHEITYRKPAFLNDDVIATVILRKVHGARAFYEIIIKRGEVVLAEVRSSWCCLDSRTRRPTRLSRGLIERFLGKAEE
ncbi:thioesterase [Labrys miyagiensis]